MSIQEALNEVSQSNNRFKFYIEHILSGDASEKEIRDILIALNCLLYTSPSPRDATLSRMPSSA